MERINKIIVFGDSLQDNGNLYKTELFPKEPFYKGRFTNGLVANEYFTKMLESYQNNKIELLNFAIGGALTSDKCPKKILTEKALPIYCQFNNFLDEHKKFNSDELLMLNGGGNNLLFMLNNEKPYINIKPIFKIANDLSHIIDISIKKGCKNIIVWNVPDLTITPAITYLKLPKYLKSILVKILKWRVVKENKKLDKKVKSLRKKYRNINIKIFNSYEFLHKSLKEMHKYGITNIKDYSVLSFGGTDESGNVQEKEDIKIINNPESTLFWDFVHPTTKVHKIIAEEIFNFWKKS